MRGIITFVIALAFTTNVMAQGFNDPVGGLNGDGTVVLGELSEHNLPTGKPCISQEDGQRYQCFTLEEMKELKKWEAELAFYETGYHQLSEKVTLLEGKVLLLEEENDRLFLKWKEENKLRLEAENKPKLGSALAWGVAGTAIIAALTLGLVLAFK